MDQKYLFKGNISFYGYMGKKLPDFVYKKTEGTSKVFVREDENFSLKVNSGNVHVVGYGNLLEMREKQADVIFLDHRATKVLLAKFPVTSHYLLLRLVPRWSWLIAIPGLIRRVLIGLVKIEGIVKLPADGQQQRWLVIKHLLSRSLQTRYSISSEVGIQGLLDYLNQAGIKYVILRFYEKLPALNRIGGDIDILVSDEDEEKMREFLRAHPGTIGVDVWTPSRTSHNSITYYPPPLARQIIASAIGGPANSKVPAPKEAFLSFAYHALYHKGCLAGVPTNLSGLEVNKYPENDYTGVLKKMAEDLKIDIDINMEDLDNYLRSVGWQPKFDTLAKIAPWNKWVKKRFFSMAAVNEIGLGVLIIKNKAFELGVVDQILEEIVTLGEFKIIKTKRFNKEEASHVANQLRGGVWDDVSGAQVQYFPAMAVVIMDIHFARSSKARAVQGGLHRRIRELKAGLRKKFDKEKISLIHATDFTYEAWEYIDDCFPDERELIKQEIEEIYQNIPISWKDRIELKIFSLPSLTYHYLSRLKKDALGKLVQVLVN